MPELLSGPRAVSDARPVNNATSVDPLDALRSADHRPASTIWREQIGEWLRESASPRTGLRLVGYVAVASVAAAIVWQLFVVTEPPVEDSIPFATVGTTVGTPPTTDLTSAPSTTAVATAASSVDQATATHREEVVVHVAGAVADPGLVTGFEGWRIDDAVRAAGGATPTADLDRLNLAALVADGERIYVPVIGEDEPVVLRSSGGVAASGPGESSAVVNINSADATELQTLPGVGPATAATIVSHRNEHGTFGDVDALVAVRGIGPATLEALREHVSVG